MHKEHEDIYAVVVQNDSFDDARTISLMKHKHVLCV